MLLQHQTTTIHTA